MNVASNNTLTASKPAATRAGLRVLILQSVLKDAAILAGFFTKRHDQVWQTTRAAEAFALLQRHKPDLVIIDLHLSGSGWLDLLRHLQQDCPATGVIVTNKYPDLQREVLAKDQGVLVFLRQPFTRPWIERALTRLAEGARRDDSPLPAVRTQPIASNLPRVRFPVGLKITLPFILLALVVAAGAAYLVSRYIVDTLQGRFTGQLVDTGTLSADWMVQQEGRQLQTLRLLANTQGLAQALAAGDSESLRRLALPIIVNNHEESVEIIDPAGTSQLSLRHVAGGAVESFTVTRGDTDYQQWSFVRSVLAQQTDAQGDKFAGLVHAPWGDYFYVAGPILDAQGRLAGALLVGVSLPTLVRDIRETTLAQVTVYDAQGRPLASTLPAADGSVPLSADQASQILARQSQASFVRDFTLASSAYSEIIGPWTARGGQDMGLLGSALTRNYFAQPSTLTRVQAFGLVGAAFIIIIALGAILARRITRPLTEMVRASSQVALGNLQVKVDTYGDDEVAVLAHAFNYMVTGLQEGFIYHDLLGRTVSPAVREQLRHAFASGNLRLEGQNVLATVLRSDIRAFTSLSETEEPTTVMAWLNEYFGEIAPIISARNGVVDKFEGDAVLAFFGILPHPLTPKESAYQACQAAVAMLQQIELLNQRRTNNGKPPFVTGIGVNTGLVTAGGLGAAERLNYTIIGDTVNTAQRLESITREFGTSGIVVSESTCAAMEERAAEFSLEPLGIQSFKGKRDEVLVYRLRGLVAPAGTSGP